MRIQNVQAVEVNGKHFRSKLEAQTAETLQAMGIPFRYEERKIVLLEGFRSPFQKDKIRQITYTPDFEIGTIMLECKGFETPEWKLKKKMLFKYLMENEPDTVFYQIHDCKKQLLEVIDKHLPYLGFTLQVSSKSSKKKPSETFTFESVKEALNSLNLKNKALGPIVASLTGKKQWVYGFNWKLNRKTILW